MYSRHLCISCFAPFLSDLKPSSCICCSCPFEQSITCLLLVFLSASSSDYTLPWGCLASSYISTVASLSHPVVSPGKCSLHNSVKRSFFDFPRFSHNLCTNLRSSFLKLADLASGCRTASFHVSTRVQLSIRKPSNLLECPFHAPLNDFMLFFLTVCSLPSL